MAKLEGRAGMVGPTWFSITPLKSDIEAGDATAYLVEFWPGQDDRIESRVFSVADWLMGQDELWLVARAFEAAPVLTEATIAHDPWNTGKPSDAYLYKTAEWLHVTLWGNRRNQRIAVSFFIQEQDDPKLFRTHFVNTSVAQAVKFGLELADEIIAFSPNWAIDLERTMNNWVDPNEED